jgi:hypothetical protein
LLFEKICKKRAYHIKSDKEWAGIIDWAEDKGWSFTADCDVQYSIEALKEITAFMESLQGQEGDKVVW